MTRRAIAAVLLATSFLVVGCGSGSFDGSATPTSTRPAPVTEADGSPPPAGQKACTADGLRIANVVGPASLLVTPELSVKLANASGQPCWLDGRPGISLRTPGGVWFPFEIRPANATPAGGPAWTGVFEPTTTGVVVMTQFIPQAQTNGSPQKYEALRLTLPNSGGTLEYTGIDITVVTRIFTVQAIKAG